MGTFKIFWGWGKQKLSLYNLKRKHLVTCLLEALISEFPWKGYDCPMSPRCSMSPHLTICWKVGPWHRQTLAGLPIRAIVNIVELFMRIIC